MKTWFSHQRAALRRAFRRLWGAPFNTLLTALVIGIAMTLPAAAYLLIDNLAALGRSASGAQQISLFMDVGASRAQVSAVQGRLEAILPGQWRFVSREAALMHLKENADLAEVVGSLPRNPLPDAFIVTPRDGDPEGLEKLRETFAAWPGVAHVQLDSAWVKRFDAFVKLGRLLAHLLAALFAVGLVAVTFNTIRLQVLGQAEEIILARLIGATDAFIRRPFQYAGAVQGALGGLVAGGLVKLGFWVLAEPVHRLAALYGSDFALGGPGAAHFAVLIGLGALLGGLGAWLSVGLSLRQFSA